MHEMHNTKGAFYSAIDADSEGIEGKYYVWEYDEVMNILGEESGHLFATAYDITPEGNFEGKNVPNQLESSLETIANTNNMSISELKESLENSRVKLLNVREQRVYPHVDDKVLTSWNAMMIAALAKAGKAFNVSGYTKTAVEAAQFIEGHLIQDERIKARFRDDEVKFNGYLDDYAFLTWAYIELYEATFLTDYLEKARHTADGMLDLFWDDIQGGFFFNGNDSEQLLTREKELYDGALPSGNSVAANCLVRLGHLTGNTVYLDKLESMYHAFHDDVTSAVAASTHFIQSLLLTEFPTKEVVVLGEENNLISRLQQEFTPEISLLSSGDPAKLASIAPFAAAYKQVNDKITVYVCENFACHQPTTDIKKAWKLINDK